MKLTDDQVHELLNGGLGEAKAEVLAVLDTEERLFKKEIGALSGVGPTLTKHLKFLVRHGLVKVHRSSKAKVSTYYLNPMVLDTAKAIQQLPKGAKAQAPVPSGD